MATADLVLLVAHGDEATLRTALSLALAAVTVGDRVLVFASQSGLALLAAELPMDELSDLRAVAIDEGVHWVACADSMLASGQSSGSLLAGVELAGAARFYLAARQAKVSLYL